MKGITKVAAVLLTACLVIGLVGCGGEEEATPTPTASPTPTPTPVPNELKIGVIGPMQFLMGEHHWFGAQLAAQEINAEGGIQVGDETYEITLVQVESNELVNPLDAQSAAEEAITVDDVYALMGSIRSEAAVAIQEVAMDYDTFFFICGASYPALCTNVTEDYDRYKYTFRVTPINLTHLATVGFQLLHMAAQEIRSELGIMVPKVAILAEKNLFGDGIVAAAQAQIPNMGMEVIGAWQPSDKATDVTAELTAIQEAGAHIIYTAFSGPVGIPYATKWGELEIPAASVGINVMAQDDGFWDATGGAGNYEMTMNIYARDVAITEETLPFIASFIDEMGETPTYNAGTYDAVYILKEAIERAGTLDRDAVIEELENTDHVGTAGRAVFDETHDITWGPGYVTAIGIQWQDGVMKGVWPPADGSWEGVVYEGIVDYELPPWMVEFWSQ